MKANHSLFKKEALLSFLLLAFLVAGANNLLAQAHAGHSTSAAIAQPVDIIRDGGDVPPPVGDRQPTTVHVTLTAEEVLGTLDASANTTYRYWTFNGKVPGPMIRVRQGDQVEVTLRNAANSHMTHSVDFHAALGPGGGAAFSQATPGQSKTFTFEATTPGLFVYHCGTPMIAEHMANGMYGMILVEPEGGLPVVDREYYVVQGEIYTAGPKGTEGLQKFSAAKLMEERPEYFVLNGAVDALTNNRAMPAKVGETVRVFYGNAGPNATASVHAVGEIFTKVYGLGSLTSAPMSGVQTATVPSGGAAVLEFVAKFPGKVALMDHAIARMAKGDMAVFDVTGPQSAELMHAGPVEAQVAALEAAPAKATAPVTTAPMWSGAATARPMGRQAQITGMTEADEAANFEESGAVAYQDDGQSMSHLRMDGMEMMHMGGMDMGDHAAHGCCHHAGAGATEEDTTRPAATLDGCLTLADDGRALLKVFQSSKIYRLEAQPLLFSANANRLVHVSGHPGSVMAAEDPRFPSFVVDAVDQVAPSCSAKISAAQLRSIVAKQAAPVGSNGTVVMTDAGFVPQTMVVNVGEKVVWKNSSEVTHNVVADPGRAVYAVDVKLPAGVAPFGSQLMQPGQAYSRTFTTPGIYRYVCTLHEASGMKGVIIVKGTQVLRASK